MPEVPELIGGRAKKGNCLQHLCSLQNRKKACQSHRERARRSLYQRQGSSLSSEGSVRWDTHGTGRRVVGWVCPCVSKEPQGWGASGRTRLWKTELGAAMKAVESLFLGSLWIPLVIMEPSGTCPCRKRAMCLPQAKAHSDSTCGSWAPVPCQVPS